MKVQRVCFLLLALILVMQYSIFWVYGSSQFEIDEVTFVSRVIDGDTFVLSSGDRVRLADVDSPESGEIGYSQAKSFLEALVSGKTVYLDIDDVSRTDKYGRLVCVVYVDYNSTHYMNVNKALLTAELAVIWNFPNEFNPYSWSLYNIKLDEEDQLVDNVDEPETPSTPEIPGFPIEAILIGLLFITSFLYFGKRKSIHLWVKLSTG